MTHRLATNCAKNYCNRTLIVKVIVENVVTCFLDTVYNRIDLLLPLTNSDTVLKPCSTVFTECYKVDTKLSLNLLLFTADGQHRPHRLMMIARSPRHYLDRLNVTDIRYISNKL